MPLPSVPADAKPYKASLNERDRIINDESLPVVNVDPADLTATQDFVIPDRLARIKGDLRDDKPVLIVRQDGVDYIEEGHHRAVAALRTGSKVPARIVEVGTDGKLHMLSEGVGRFAEADSGKDVALGGPDGRKVETLLSASIEQGTRKLSDLARTAVKRLIDKRGDVKQLFTDDERQELADQLAATNATADLLGRVRIAERADEAERRAKARADFAEFCGGKGGTKGPCPTGGADVKGAGQVSNLTVKGQKVEIHTDPSPEGLKNWLKASEGNELRGMVKDGKAYVWESTAGDGTTEIFHDTVASKLLGSDEVADGEKFIVTVKDGEVQVGTYVGGGMDNAAARWAKSAGIKSFAEQDRHARFSAEPTVFRFDEGSPLKPMPPRDALAYFRRLYPRLGIDVDKWGPLQESHAFTAALATDETMLARIQDIIAERLETGEGISTAPAEIDAILDAAGVTPRNPQYGEAVFRTQMMESYRAGSQRQLAEVVDTFPTILYSNPNDGRSRPEHAAKDGKYFDARIPFTTIRGEGPENVVNCRCVGVEIDKWEWQELQAQGAKWETV